MIATIPLRSLTAGLLRGLAGCTVSEVARDLGCGSTTALRAVRQHDHSLRTDPAYAALAADVVHRVMRRDFGQPGRALDLPRHVPAAGTGRCGKRRYGV